MTTADFTDFPRTARRSSVLIPGALAIVRAAPVDALAGAVTLVRRWRAFSKSFGELQRLDDRMLLDIGLTRSMVRSPARHAYDERTRHARPRHARPRHARR